MAEFAYNNTQNVSTGFTLFELNCGYHSSILYKKDIDLYFKLKSANKLLTKLQKLMTLYRENLHYAQKL